MIKIYEAIILGMFILSLVSAYLLGNIVLSYELLCFPAGYGAFRAYLNLFGPDSQSLD